MRRIAGWQHHFNDQQTTGWLHRLADMAKDRKALVFVPVMEDVRKDVSIRPVGDTFEEIAGLDRHPIAYAFGVKQSRCVFTTCGLSNRMPRGPA